ncbi:MAG: L-threonylcarbamoyladenylate synthase [Dehalococcoidia bacterium]
MNDQFLTPNQLDLAVAILRRGGIVAFPTDTVYGLAALPSLPGAVRRLFEAKRRPPEKAIPILLAGVSDVEQVADEIPEAARLLATAFWPGALTLVLKRREGVPGELATVGVRVPNLDLARGLIRAAGGMLAVTSANLSGGPNCTTAEMVMAQLTGRIDAAVDGGHCPGGIESSIVDVTVEPARLLRLGGISREQLAAVVRLAG